MADDLKYPHRNVSRFRLVYNNPVSIFSDAVLCGIPKAFFRMTMTYILKKIASVALGREPVIIHYDKTFGEIFITLSVRQYRQHK